MLTAVALYNRNAMITQNPSFIGNYLGIDVAIKEVLPSNDYDVAKYFEREWRLMKCARYLAHIRSLILDI